MQILFDQCTPAPLRRALAGHSVSTAYEMGWSSLANGDLLSAAEARFDLLVTTDQNLRYQQDLSGRRLKILVSAVQFRPQPPNLQFQPCQPHVPAADSGLPRLATGAGEQAVGLIISDEDLLRRVPTQAAFELVGNGHQMAQ